MNFINDYISGWRYYNHALIPTCAPDEKPKTEYINRKIWFFEKKPLLVRWTYDFDCKTETNFWYVIKDKPFDISELNSHYRNQIKKGLKHFSFNKINPNEYVHDFVRIQEKAFKAYGNNKHTKIDNKIYENCTYFGAFSRETNLLCGYIVVYEINKCIQFDKMKTNPCSEKNGISEALVYGLLDYYKDELSKGKYINDGTRSILHETNFQEYLIKKFHFRKAYCRLAIIYNPLVRFFVYTLYPFRKLIKNKRISALLLMQEIVNSDKLTA